MATEIRVPTLGESVTEATIGKWFKKPGEAVKADEPIVELETDKVTVEVPAPAAGVLAGVNPLFGLNGYLLGTLGGALATGSVFMSVQATGAMAVILEDVPQVRGPGAAGAMAMLTVLTGLIMLGLGLAPARLAGAVHPDRGAHRIRQRCGGQHRAGTARQRHRLRQ